MGATHTLVAAKRRRTITIEVDADAEHYQDSLITRLREYGISQKELCDEISKEGKGRVTETQMSRWVARPSVDTERWTDMHFSNVLRIEKAIIAIRARQPNKR